MTGIVDGHHHIWRQADLPWLQGPMVPRIFGPYEPIRRDYPIEEYLADIAGSGVEKSVYVQTNWAKSAAVDEVAWVQATADAHGWPHAIVGYADLLDDDVGDTLKRQSAFPLMRGVRMQLHWHENPQYRFAAAPGPDERRHLPPQPAPARRPRLVLRPAGLRPADGRRRTPGRRQPRHHLRAAALRHAGGPDRAGRTAWREGMQRLADRPNVVNKLSGLGTFIHRNDPAHVADIVGESVAIFGPDRCLFGSNFPIEKLWTSYRDLVDTLRQALDAFPDAARRAMLAGTAERVYRL